MFVKVTLTPADRITFVPHPQHDLLEYDDLACFASQISQQGYYGGIRLLMVGLLGMHFARRRQHIP